MSGVEVVVGVWVWVALPLHGRVAKTNPKLMCNVCVVCSIKDAARKKKMWATIGKTIVVGLMLMMIICFGFAAVKGFGVFGDALRTVQSGLRETVGSVGGRARKTILNLLGVEVEVEGEL